MRFKNGRGKILEFCHWKKVRTLQYRRALNINVSVAKLILCSKTGLGSKKLRKELSQRERVAWNEKFSIYLVKDLRAQAVLSYIRGRLPHRSHLDFGELA